MRLGATPGAATSLPCAVALHMPSDPGAGGRVALPAAPAPTPVPVMAMVSTALMNVTHQGSQTGVAAAPLAAWTHDTASSSLDTRLVAPGEHDTAPAAPWTCRRCAAAQPALVRLGFLRHGARHGQRWPHRGWRHDQSP
jgi:hypothetical protein